MSSSQSNSESISAANSKSKKGSEEGKVYEKLSLALLAKNGYELTKDNSEFCSFAIGREVGIGKDAKFDDIVFSYIDEDNTKNLIFVQIKHKQDDFQIDSQVLSAEASKAKAKGGRDGGMQRDFNLQKYFISYLSVREELKSTRSGELENGKIKYVAIFTNIGLNSEELNNNGFRLEKAPHDIVNLFSLRKSSPTTEDFNQCYQLSDVSDGLREIFMKSSDLHRLARELAQYVVLKKYRENKIMGIDDTPIKYYHVALAKSVIRKLDQVQNSEKQMKNERYCEARFIDDFVDSDIIGSRLQLRDLLFEAIRQLDGSKQAMSDHELKGVLKETKWKVVPNFGKSKRTITTDLPCEWITVNEKDITDFLKCLVFIVNQPRVKELEEIFISSAEDTVVEGTSFRETIDKIEKTGSEFRKRIEKDLEIDQKTKYKEKWITGENVLHFFEEQTQLINISFIVTAMTLMYESETVQFGKFNQTEKLEERLDNFFSNGSKVLYINSTVTLLSSIKIFKYLNVKKDYASKDGRISINLDILRSKENRESILKAFEFESNNLLIIENRNTSRELDMEDFYYKLFNIADGNPNKKIIFIIQQDELTIVIEKYRSNFQNENSFLLVISDVIDLKDFEPAEDPITKEIILFQGQEKKASLATLTGINCWDSYVDYLSQEPFQKVQEIIDGMTLVEILNKDEIEVGSKPLGTSNLDGAYAIMFEEIDVSSLSNQLISIKSDDIYIMSGMGELKREEKINKLVQSLGLVKEKRKMKNQFGAIGSGSRIQIADDEFKDDAFKRICFDYPEKRIFWIFMKHEESEPKFILQQFYNPKFYIKRKFKNVVISKGLKKLLMSEHLYEIFIFYSVNNQQEFTDLLQFENEYEKPKTENNCKNGNIMFFTQADKARTEFLDICKQNRIVHLLRIEDKQFIWCDSHDYYDSPNNLKEYIDHEQSKICLVEEDNLIKEIKDKKVVIIADDPGMGKTTTLTKFHESKYQTVSFIETHWVLRVNLKDHLEVLRNIELKNKTFDVVNVVNFLSKVDLKLNHYLAKNLLRISLLDQNNKNTKPLLLAFDGFDEVLDEVDREKIISLLKFLKNETAAKIWITTRHHYKQLLERELFTFAIEFDPLDDDSKVAYIKNCLNDRMCLILSEKKFAEIFVQNDEMQENESIKIYISNFLNKIKSVFKSNTYEFIGTPLQLYLMLEGSISQFQDWIENKKGQNLNFDYLGTDILEVYQKFLDRKYSVYFKKMGIHENTSREKDTFIFNQYNKIFAKLSIFKSKSQTFLEKFKHVALSAGIIKSNGTNTEFIHITFRDYFAAEIFIQWIKKVPNELHNLYKHKFLLQEILKKPDYQQIRTFLDLNLKKLAETESFNEIVNNYGVLVEKVFRDEENSLIDEKGTALHCAISESNKNIVYFLLKSLKEHKDVLLKFLFQRVVNEKSALELVIHTNDIEILRLLLDAAAGISEDTLQELLHFSNTHGYNVLDTAAVWCKNFEIFKEIMNRAENKLDLIINENKKYSSLNVALRYNNQEFVRFLIQEFQQDEKSLRKLLLFHDKYFSNALGVALMNDLSMVEYLLCIAKAMKDQNATLKDMLLPEKHDVPLKFAICTKQIHFVEILLNAAKGINDDTLKRMFLKDVSEESAFLSAAMGGQRDIIKLLLETADSLGKEVLKEFAFAVNKDGKNAIHLMVEFQWYFRNISVDILKLLLDTAASLGEEVLKKLVFDSDKNGKTPIHLFAQFGLGDIIDELFKIPGEFKYQSIREKAAEMFHIISEEHHLSTYKYRLISSIENNIVSEVRRILEDAKTFNLKRNEKLRNLLLTVDNEEGRHNTLHIACINGNLNIIKELLSYAININDGGTLLMQLMTSTSIANETPFQMLVYGYTSEIKQIIESLILEAKENDNEHVVNMLQEINENYTLINSTSSTYVLLPCNNYPFSSY